jgi:hypothetical protein
MRANYDDLFRLDELRALRVLVNSAVVETSTAAVLGPAGDEVIFEVKGAYGLHEGPIVALDDRHHPLRMLLISHKCLDHAVVPVVTFSGLDLHPALVLLEGEGEVAFEGEVEAEIKDFLHREGDTVFIVLIISTSRLVITRL